MHTLKLRHEATIHALPTKLWKVLTCADYTSQFLFDDRMVSPWVEGESIRIEEFRDDRPREHERGRVLQVVPGISLRFRVEGLLPLTAHPVEIQYELEPAESGIRLILIQEADLPIDAFPALQEQARAMLQKIKWLAEYG